MDIVENWEPVAWYPMAIYSQPGKAAGAFWKEVLEWESDRSGIYFLRTDNPEEFQEITGLPLSQRMFYIGRAGQIARRLNRHLQVEKHNSASLVYKITAIGLNATHRRRNANMSDANRFLPAFRRNQQYLRNHCEMAYYCCDIDERQALLEILFSLRFNTLFNDWQTHWPSYVRCRPAPSLLSQVQGPLAHLTCRMIQRTPIAV